MISRVSGWGRYPVADCVVTRPPTPEALMQVLAAAPESIPRGNGRSYGDASLNPSNTIDLCRLDRLLEFDPATGVLTCEAGAMLADVIDAMLPRGWFPPVTPGTQFVTIGGMVASDVHGKNHHSSGSFCDHLQWIDLATDPTTTTRCSAAENRELFAATCGGMGLTGVIVRACFRMLRVETSMIRQRRLRAPSLAEAMAVFEHSLQWTYSVAWIDCLARGPQLGRCAILLGEHALEDELPQPALSARLIRARRRIRRVRVTFPAFALSRVPVQVFNRLYYAAQVPGDSLVDVDPYFYPLDAVLDWNRIYGRSGFVQYQCVLPLAASASGISALLRAVSAAGEASFLAVLKRMGRESFGMLSFPLEGYTLAMDFRVTPSNLALLERLDAITRAHAGRVYLTKDARAQPHAVAAGYPRLEAFRAVRRKYGLDRRYSSLLSRRLEL